MRQIETDQMTDQKSRNACAACTKSHSATDVTDVSTLTRSRARTHEYIPEVVSHLSHLSQVTGRWSMALAHCYPLPQYAKFLTEDLSWTRSMLRTGYYDDVPGKREEVAGYIAEAEDYLRRGGLPR